MKQQIYNTALYLRLSCGCTGVSLSDRTGHGGRKGQVSYRNTDKARSL